MMIAGWADNTGLHPSTTAALYLSGWRERESGYGGTVCPHCRQAEDEEGEEGWGAAHCGGGGGQGGWQQGEGGRRVEHEPSGDCCLDWLSSKVEFTLQPKLNFSPGGFSLWPLPPGWPSTSSPSTITGWTTSSQSLDPILVLWPRSSVFQNKKGTNCHGKRRVFCAFWFATFC